MDCFRYTDIHRLDYDQAFTTSDGKPLVNMPGAMLYNQNAISDEDAEQLLKSGAADRDERVIIMTPAQADNFAAKTSKPSIADMIRNLSDKNLAVFLTGVEKGHTIDASLRAVINLHMPQEWLTTDQETTYREIQRPAQYNKP